MYLLKYFPDAFAVVALPRSSWTVPASSSTAARDAGRRWGWGSCPRNDQVSKETRNNLFIKAHLYENIRLFVSVFLLALSLNFINHQIIFKLGHMSQPPPSGHLIQRHNQKGDGSHRQNRTLVISPNRHIAKKIGSCHITKNIFSLHLTHRQINWGLTHCQKSPFSIATVHK